MTGPTDPALVDEATGLSNEWHFEILYDFAFAAGDRGIPITLVLIQIDGVDRSGGSGSDGDVDDRVIRTGAVLAGGTREMDVVAHLGGGRFLCLLMDCNLQGGLVFADRIRSLVETLRGEWDLTLSMGMASYTKGMTESSALLDRTRRCLERAMAESGDRLVTTRDL